VHDYVIIVCRFLKFLKHLILFHVTSLHEHFVTQNTKNTAFSAVTRITIVLQHLYQVYQ